MIVNLTIREIIRVSCLHIDINKWSLKIDVSHLFTTENDFNDLVVAGYSL